MNAYKKNPPVANGGVGETQRNSGIERGGKSHESERPYH